VPALLLACLAYLTTALPGSTLGLVWPSMRLTLHEPVGALGIPLAFGVVASVVASVATGRILSRIRIGWLLALGTLLSAGALAVEALAPSLWVVTVGFVLFGFGFGATDSALNVHAARHFGARDINWMHASYGLGATIGPLMVTAVLSGRLSWRWAYGSIAVALGLVTVVFGLAQRGWDAPPRPPAPARPAPPAGASGPPRQSARRRPRAAVAVTALTFAVVEAGLESAAGI
jgi:MFS family permease